MRAPVTPGYGLMLAWLVVAPRIQTPEPLRKTDLIRLLTGGTMSTTEIADLVQRNCVSFTPTARDRQNLTSLGADSVLLARIDACLRARSATAAPHAAAGKGKGGGGELLAVPLVSRLSVPVGGTVEIGVALKRGGRAVSRARLVLLGSAAVSGVARDAEAVSDGRGIALFRFPAGPTPGLFRLTVASATGDALAAISDIELSTVPAAPVAARPSAPAVTAHPAAARTGFVLGTGQRGVVGQRAVLPLVFEVRDSQGAPIAAFPVQWTIVNGQLVAPAAATDSTGQARVDVVYGQRTGTTVVTGSAGGIARQATLYAGPGRPARLVVERGGARVERQLLVSAEGTTLLRVYCRDGFDNPLPLGGLVAAAGDESIVRVTAVTADSLGGWVTLRPGKDGITNLTIQGSGVRSDLSAMVKH